MSESAWRAEKGRGASTFYRCLDGTGCGLRFPVVPGDLFRDVCPRCGGAVRAVATVEADISTEPAFAPTRLDAVQPASQICLLLDNWRSLFNVGAAFRTADGAGLRHLYLCGITATPESQPKLAKTALGAERSVAWSYHVDAVQQAAEMQRAGAELWVLERSTASTSVFDITLGVQNRPIVLAAGNEKAGVDPALLAAADRVVHLPMSGRKQSLNVAVAVSVAAYWLRAQELAALAGQVTR